jgi:hypothetical protein
VIFARARLLYHHLSLMLFRLVDLAKALTVVIKAFEMRGPNPSPCGLSIKLLCSS